MFLPVRSVGVMGDGRTYENVVALRAVQTTDFMTADWAPLPHELLARVSNRIINEVRGINRVTYDISSKPPATIEWECLTAVLALVAWQRRRGPASRRPTCPRSGRSARTRCGCRPAIRVDAAFAAAERVHSA